MKLETTVVNGCISIALVFEPADLVVMIRQGGVKPSDTDPHRISKRLWGLARVARQIEDAGGGAAPVVDGAVGRELGAPVS